MNTLDAINAGFEAGGALLLTLNVRRLWRDRKLAGVSIVPTLWYQAWGGYNLVYYAKIHQQLSWFAGIGVFAMNTVWVVLALYFGAAERSERQDNAALHALLVYGESYGLELVRRSRGALQRGGVYIVLGRLVERGLVHGRDEAFTPGYIGIKRKLYSLTDAGLERAGDCREEP